MINFGERMKKLRLEKKFTQKQLAKRVGLAISAISAYESNSRFPTYDVMVKFARIFHVSTDYLLGLDEVRRIELTGLSDDDIDLVVGLVDRLKKDKT